MVTLAPELARLGTEERRERVVEEVDDAGDVVLRGPDGDVVEDDVAGVVRRRAAQLVRVAVATARLFEQGVGA